MIATGMSCCIVAWALSQPEPPAAPRRGQAPARQPAAANANAAPAQAPRAAEPKKFTPEQIARRNALFESDRWKKIVDGLREWASTQAIYTPEQVEQIRRTYDQRLLQETPAEVEATMGEMEQWLGAVLSPEAREANAYLARTLALESKSAAEKTRERLPNVAFMTPAQVQQALIEFKQQRQSDAAAAAAVNQAREQQIQMTRSAVAAQQRASQQALADAYRFSASRPSYQSPLSPPAPNRRIDWGSPSPQFIFGSWGREGVILGGHRW